MIKGKVKNFLVGLSGLAIFVGVWQLVTALEIWSTGLLPSPAQTVEAIWELAENGTLFPYLGISLGRFAAGYLIAIAAALPLGLVLGWFLGARRVANPVLQVLRPISPTAWLPFIVLWFGIGDAPAIAIITIAAFFPVLFSTIASVGTIDPTYVRVAENFELSRLEIFWKVCLPAAFPQIMVGLRLAIGTGWIFLVSGEMVGAQSGLGYLIVDARNNLRTDQVLAGIVLIGLTGWLLDSLMERAQRYIAHA